jgi:hypothetical protein
MSHQQRRSFLTSERMVRTLDPDWGRLAKSRLPSLPPAFVSLLLCSSLPHRFPLSVPGRPLQGMGHCGLTRFRGYIVLRSLASWKNAACRCISRCQILSIIKKRSARSRGHRLLLGGRSRVQTMVDLMWKIMLQFHTFF